MTDNIISREEYREITGRKNTKYSAQKTVADGMMFDSKKEAARYGELKMLEKSGEISGLEMQKTYHLIPAQYSRDGKLLERGCSYRADFCYRTKNGEYVVEDVKGMRTPAYKIKRKLMLYLYGIQIREI